MTEFSDALVLFGATGDLAQRMLFPSVFNLFCEGRLPKGFRVVGSGRSDLSREAFQALVTQSIGEPAAGCESNLQAFLQRLHYCAVATDRPEDFDRLATVIRDAGITRPGFYLSTPPSLFGPVTQGLARARLAGPSTRIAMEKPIGHDLASSRALNQTVGAVFDERRVFRVDHYLGKETVQNLLVLRFGNVLFEPLWNATAIEHVQITVAEAVGLEGRVSYYDGVGALRDMVQNHMLQLLALVAMEPPSSYTAPAVRDEKVKVLRSLRPMDAATVAAHSVRGQYTAGAIAGQAVDGYAQELGAGSPTETFVALKAHVDNWRWKGVPFYLRTGKRLPERRSEIVIQFRPVPHSIFAGTSGALEANRLVIRLQPQEGVGLSLMARRPGLDRGGVAMRGVDLDVSLAGGETRRRIAYERLLLDFIEDDATLFVRADEVEAAWTWVDSIHDAWSAAGTPAKSYTAGSWGPAAAAGMIARDEASWND